MCWLYGYWARFFGWGPFFCDNSKRFGRDTIHVLTKMYFRELLYTMCKKLELDLTSFAQKQHFYKA